VCIECIAAPLQSNKSTGLKGIYREDKYFGVQCHSFLGNEITEAQDWITNHKEDPFVEAIATIEVSEQGRGFMRWETLYSHDIDYIESLINL